MREIFETRKDFFHDLSRVLLLSSTLVLFAACERQLKVTINGKNPPTFTFNGPGNIQRVFIFQVTDQGKVPPYGSALWVLYPRQSLRAADSPAITYGIVPEGFYQRVPASGTPPPLEEGKIYGFGAETEDAPGGDVWFSIRGGQSMRQPKTDPADPEMR